MITSSSLRRRASSPVTVVLAVDAEDTVIAECAAANSDAAAAAGVAGVASLMTEVRPSPRAAAKMALEGVYLVGMKWLRLRVVAET